MSQIKTILFDADGVLIRGEMASRHFEQKYGISHETTVDFYRGPFLDCLLGKADMYDTLPQYLAKWGWEKTPEDFVQEWFDYENKVDSEIVAYIQKLRAQGVGCYVATNQDRHRAQYMLEKMGFADSFDGLFASAHLGSKKPDLEFFEKVLTELAITDKQSVLFWDDTPEHITGAQEFGIHAELYTEFNDFKQKLTDSYKLLAG